MKHFILLVVVCALGYFLAPSVLGIKASSVHSVQNQGEYLPEDGKMYRTVMGKRGRQFAVTTASFVLVLDELESVQNDEKLITFEGCDKELGFFLTKDGMVANWDGNRWNPEMNIPYARLLNNENVMTVNGRDCLALTMLVNGVAAVTDEPNPGVTLVDASGSVLYHAEKLNTVKNTSYVSIRAKENRISHMVINPRLCSLKAAAKRTVKLEKKALQKPGSKMVAFGGGGLVILLLSAIWSRVCPVKLKSSTAPIKRQGLVTH